MAIVNELIKAEDNGTISFGNYELSKKTKLMNFDVGGNLYDIRTFNEITKNAVKEFQKHFKKVMKTLVV